MEFPSPSNSLYALVDVSSNDVVDRGEELESSLPNTNNGNERFHCGSIPSVANILDPIAPEYSSFGILHRSALPGLQERTEFTPFLLPNPNSYYNPLNPPRSILNPTSYNITPMYPPQLTTESNQLPHLPQNIQHLILKQQTRREPKIVTPSNQISFSRESGQASTLAPSTIHFPLSDSPSKIFKRGPAESRTFSQSITTSNKSNTSTELPIGGPPLITTDNATTTNRFILVEQPNDIQRKSYKKENRCLLPNPLIICMKELPEEQKRDPPIIMDGVVVLKLVNNDGTELPPHKQNALESIEGGLTHPLGDDHTTCFSVKVLQTSEGNLFRLIFNVSYRLKGQGRVEEQIISRPFAVYSNKHNRNSRKKQKKVDNEGE